MVIEYYYFYGRLSIIIIYEWRSIIIFMGDKEFVYLQ